MRKARLAEAAAVAIVLAAFVAAVSPTLGQPLVDNNSFRQTQTAFTARIYHQQGIDLLHPKLPVLGEPFEVPFEFPLFQAAAAVAMDAGVRDDVAMRATGLACFLLSAVFLYGLVRRVDGRASALAALVAFVCTPFALVWGRSSMIEYLATAGAVGFAWATIAWRENGRPDVGGLALAAGLVGMLVKPTTAVFWLIPPLAYRPSSTRGAGPNGRRGWLLVGLVVIPIAAALLWTRHADAIKDASPATAWLTSDELGEWNFGTLSQRFGRGFWGVIERRVVDHMLGLRLTGLALVAVGLVALARSTQRLFWISVGLAAVVPPFFFTNLYLQHDYYLAAVAPAIAALAGFAFGYVWRRLPHRPLVVVPTAAVALLALAGPLVLDRDYWRRIYDDLDPPALARELAMHTRSNDRIGVDGLDWSPETLYYADRWGLMAVERKREATYDALHDAGYRYLLVADPFEADLRPLSRWPWLGALGPHTYVLADDPAELGDAAFVSTSDPGVVGTGRVLTPDVRVPCGAPLPLRSGRRGTLIRISNPAPDGRVGVTPSLAPLPTRRTVLVGPVVTSAGVVTLTCSGQEALLVDVLEAPLRAGD